MEKILYEIYEDLGEFFAGAQRRRELFLMIFAGYIGVLALQMYLGFGVELEGLYFSFSSIVVSLMALVALLGFVIVFKYQNISTREDRLLEESNKDTSHLARLGGRITATSSNELLENILPHVSEVPGEGEDFRIMRLRRIKSELESHEFVRGFLSRNMLRVTVYAFFVVLLDLFLLSMAPFLAANPLLAVSALYISFFLVADVLRLVINSISSSLL
jgi:hypothetical protein